MCEDVCTKIDGIVPRGPLRGRLARIVLHHAKSFGNHHYLRYFVHVKNISRLAGYGFLP